MSTITLWMKSGNQIRLRFIKNWKVRSNGNSIVELTIERNTLFDWLPHQKLIVSSIMLSEIEAITRG